MRCREDLCRHGVLRRERLRRGRGCGAAERAAHKRAVGQIRGTRAARTGPTGHVFLCRYGAAVPRWEQRAAGETSRGVRSGQKWQVTERMPDASGSGVSTVEGGLKRRMLPGCKTASKRRYAKVNF